MLDVFYLRLSVSRIVSSFDWFNWSNLRGTFYFSSK